MVEARQVLQYGSIYFTLSFAHNDGYVFIIAKINDTNDIYFQFCETTLLISKVSRLVGYALFAFLSVPCVQEVQEVQDVQSRLNEKHVELSRIPIEWSSFGRISVPYDFKREN